MDTKKKSIFLTWDMPVYLPLVLSIIAIVAAYTGALSTDMAGSLSLMMALGFIFNEIGERIPFWNSYIGGGIVLTFVACSFIFTYDILPVQYEESIASFMDDANFLNLFVIMLVTGSILGLDRKLLIRSFAGYIPAIFGGLIGAALLGIVAGLLFGINPFLILLRYVLPIMGGGNGAGAVPLSQIYETVTGDAAANYYSFAIIILTIANIFAILTGAILNRIGEVRPALTGDRSSLMRKGADFAKEDEDVKITMKDLGGAFFLAVTCYVLGLLFSHIILPEILGAPIHEFAYMIIFVAIAAGTGIIPANIRAAAKRLQSFFASQTVLALMVGVAMDVNINDLISALTLSNVVIALAIVVGAILGSAIVGWLVGFYPIDSAVTAGLCMANRGGSGDIAVLSASHRMGLIAYAQLSSRLGGGIVLILGSLLMGALQSYL